MPTIPVTAEEVSEDNRGALGLEVKRDEWEDATVIEEVKTESNPEEIGNSEEDSSRSCEQDYGTTSAEDQKYLNEYGVSFHKILMIGSISGQLDY